MLKDIIAWGSVLASAALVVNSNVDSLPEWVPGPRPNPPAQAGGTRANNIKAITQAIIGQESGWNYKAVNPHSSALGFAQIMPANVGPWAREAGLGNVSTQQFLNSPDIQRKVIAFKIGQYYDWAMKKTGGNARLSARMVAALWYSGRAELHNDRKPQPYLTNGVYVYYPSIGEYCDKAEASAIKHKLVY